MSAAVAAHEYEVIINAAPEVVWQAITSPDSTQKYYFKTRVESTWEKDSDFRYYNLDGSLSSEGKVIEIEPQSHLKTTFTPTWIPDSQASTVTWDIQPLGTTALVKLTHDSINDTAFAEGQFHAGWIYVLSSLKSLIETGEALPDLF
ncbi:SRPBCC domain-containing protein [Tengunoibacter tsumagoiensis]|uniref:Activator of Hsp90 ATPase homologue 1/2-like C-terminal domain-containing protein n=1 Tax=Tengunoibacter tsumagoiensis TaxID=2014871 RepID=A0A402A9W8_9CHLR|nr:SRPBCC domain-containing protein [Tengunoibacter tsumagoiensis]GCE15816.1 hypothetical protein KTT_56750 [Tengunoibacter tsumagoiensis]